MQFTPKRFKFKKMHKGRLKDSVSKNFNLQNRVGNGIVLLRALESGRLEPKHLTCCLQSLNKKLKRISQIRLLVFPQTSITKKPLEVRMGKGKGSVDTWVCNVFSGTPLLEVEGNNILAISKSLKALRFKLPIKTQIVYEI